MTPRTSPPGAFRPDLTHEDAARLFRDLPAARARRTRGRVRLVGAVAAALVVLGVVATTLRAPASGLLALADGAAIPVGATLDVSARPLAFADGSRITALADASTLAVVTSRPDRFVTLLTHGAIAVEVTPGGPREWIVETDLATVQVVGTGFDVVRDGDGLEVRVRHGIVVVSGERVPGRLRELTAGMSLRVHGAALAMTEPAPPDAGAAAEPVIAPANAAALDAGVPPVDADTAAPRVASAPTPTAAPHVAAPPPDAAVATDAAVPVDAPSLDAAVDHTLDHTADHSLDHALDHFAALRRSGQPDAAIAVLAEAIARAASPAEAAALRLELGRYELAIGRAAAAQAVLAAIDGPGVPPELVAAARALAHRAGGAR